MKIMPSEIAGVTMHGSPSGLTASTSNFGPAGTILAIDLGKYKRVVCAVSG